MIIKKLLAVGALSAGLVGSVAGVAAASAGHPVSAAAPAAAAVHHAKAERGEPPSHEPDGPGGHQDPNGQNVDHQFNGVE